MASGITALSQWHNYYEAKAQVFLRQCYLPPNAIETRRSLLNDHLKAYAQTTLSSRAQVLRNSDAWASVVQGTAVAGAIPMGKVVVKAGGVLFFASKALESFGLDGDLEAELFDIALKAKLIETNTEKVPKGQVEKELRNAIKSGVKGFWEKEGMADRIRDELTKEFSEEVIVETIEELVHLIPVFGQIWSYGVGYHRAEKRLNKVLDMVTERAHEVHVGLVVPLICHTLVYSKDRPPLPIPYTLSVPSVWEVKKEVPFLLEEARSGRSNIAPLLTWGAMTKPPAPRRQTSFLVRPSQLPQTSSLQALLMLSLFSAAIYIFGLVPVLVSLFRIMVFGCKCILLVPYYFLYFILGLMIAVVSGFIGLVVMAVYIGFMIVVMFVGLVIVAIVVFL